jgi:mortality factor 4-like protein 1
MLQYVSIPRTPNISQIVDSYLSSREERFNEVIFTLKIIFEKYLGSQLLYEFEREQHLEITKMFPTIDLCSIYGIEHLLRLIAKLPTLLAQFLFEESVTIATENNLNDFVHYLSEGFVNQTYTTTYETCPDDYGKNL